MIIDLTNNKGYAYSLNEETKTMIIYEVDRNGDLQKAIKTIEHAPIYNDAQCETILKDFVISR